MTKGPAVAALYAMRAVKELGIPVTKMSVRFWEQMRSAAAAILNIIIKWRRKRR